MRITAVEAIAIDIPLDRNFGGSTYSVLKRSTVITRLRTDDGLVSEVYNGDNRAHGPQIAAMVQNELFNAVKGLSIYERELAWQRMFALTHSAGDKKLLLEAIALEHLPAGELMERLTAELTAVNAALWDVEDGKRDCERRQDFGPAFVALARRVYIENDQRAAIKRAINDLSGSEIIEEKSYKPYLAAPGS